MSLSTATEYLSPRRLGRTRSEVAILVYAADEAVSRLYGLKFELAGYVVLHPGDRESVETALAGSHPDLVFVDARGLGAWETIKPLRAASSIQGIPLLLLSDDREAELARRGFRLRPNEHVVMSAEHRAELRNENAKESRDE